MMRRGEPPIRIAVFTALYPNAEQPRHGIFVEERLRKLVATGRVEARVIAPVPWFWSTHRRFGHYARLAAVARQEVRHGLIVDHPRYVVVPKVGMVLGPASMARAAAPALAALRADGFDFDLIDAHYFYPDGVAAARLARRFDRPFVVTARGADLNSIAEMRVPRRQIKSAALSADALVTVAHSLADKLIRLGVDFDKIRTLRNGVDIDRFTELDRARCRQELALDDGPIWLCVGHLIERKGVNVAIDGLAQTRDVILLVVGDGPLEASLREQAVALGVSARVRFVGAVAHDRLPVYYNAADALVLPARSEGMPNVILEAIACGTVVLASAVDGIPEVIRDITAGRLLESRSGQALASAWRSLTPDELDENGRAARRQYAQSFSWQATTQGQIALFEQVIAAHKRAEQRPVSRYSRWNKG